MGNLEGWKAMAPCWCASWPIKEWNDDHPRFTAPDTWFFRESRPMEAIGGAELASIFPPPPRTLLGALRSAIGDATGVDWQAFAQQKEAHGLYPHIGHGDDLGPLLNFQGDRLYPVPLYVIANAQGKLDRLHIGKAG